MIFHWCFKHPVGCEQAPDPLDAGATVVVEASVHVQVFPPPEPDPESFVLDPATPFVVVGESEEVPPVGSDELDCVVEPVGDVNEVLDAVVDWAVVVEKKVVVVEQFALIWQ